MPYTLVNEVERSIFLIKKVNFDYNDNITAITKEQFDAHLALYEGYIDKTNEITSKLQGNEAEREDANSTYSIYRGLKESESFALDGCILHELYFENIGGAGSAAYGNTQDLLSRQFGSLSYFMADLKACCKAARGWCVCSYEMRTASVRNIMLDAHNVGNIALSSPILVIDMYEHAYFYDYANNKNKYIDAIIGNLNWNIIEERVKYLMNSKKIG